MDRVERADALLCETLIAIEEEEMACKKAGIPTTPEASLSSLMRVCETVSDLLSHSCLEYALTVCADDSRVSSTINSIKRVELSKKVDDLNHDLGIRSQEVSDQERAAYDRARIDAGKMSDADALRALEKLKITYFN